MPGFISRKHTWLGESENRRGPVKAASYALANRNADSGRLTGYSEVGSAGEDAPEEGSARNLHFIAQWARHVNHFVGRRAGCERGWKPIGSAAGPRAAPEKILSRGQKLQLFSKLFRTRRIKFSAKCHFCPLQTAILEIESKKKENLCEGRA